MALAPKGTKIYLAFDQSEFVKQSLIDVFQEIFIASALVGIMTIIFLGSWCSTLIVITSIPLAIMTSIAALHITGQTINIMTLGGLALSVGMLVDDATVEIENIHRNHAMGKPLAVSILDGAHQIAMPALVGTLCICIVFAPGRDAERRFEISVHSSRYGRDLRDAHVVSALANPGRHDGDKPIARRSQGARNWRAGRRVPGATRSGFRAFQREIQARAHDCAAPSRACSRMRRRSDFVFAVAVARGRPGFLFPTSTRVR
jgi:hypothetical protein